MSRRRIHPEHEEVDGLMRWGNTKDGIMAMV